MDCSLFGIPSTLWLFELSLYLHPKDMLALRLMSTYGYRCVNRLLPQLASAFVRLSVSITAGIDPVLRNEIEEMSKTIISHRAKIADSPFSVRVHINELKSFGSPAPLVIQAMQVVIAVKTGSVPATWQRVQKELSNPGAFVRGINEKLLSDEVGEVPVEAMEILNKVDFRRLNDACSGADVLLTMVLDYIAIQDCWKTDVGKLYRLIDERLKTVEAIRGQYEQLTAKLATSRGN